MNLSLHTVDARDVTFYRRLGSGRRMLLSAPGQPLFTLTLKAADRDACHGDAIDVAIDPGPLRLFHAHGLLCLLGLVAPPADAARLHLAIRLALSRWPQALIEAIGMPTLSLAADLPPTMDMQLTLQREDVCERAIGRAPAAVWERLIDSMTPIARVGIESLSVAWPMVVGRTKLSLRQLRGLETGDIVRLKEILFDASGEGVITLGDLVAQVRLIGIPGVRSLQVLSISKKSIPMPMQTIPVTATRDVNVESPVDTLALTLVAELGTVRSSVGELQALAVGCVFELGERHPGEVTLRVQDGQTFAHGEMVDVGGRIGVRITRLAALT